MRRDIEFRGLTFTFKIMGRDEIKREWQYGNLKICENDVTKIVSIDGLRHIEPEMVVDPDTVGQYTGLWDSDGEALFEDDVLEVYGDEGPFPVVVRFYDGAFRVHIIDGGNGDEFSMLLSDLLNRYACHLVGNIHDGYPKSVPGCSDNEDKEQTKGEDEKWRMIMPSRVQKISRSL